MLFQAVWMEVRSGLVQPDPAPQSTMKRTYDDRRGGGGHDRDEASYYRDPSTVLASGSSTAAASPQRRAGDPRERDHQDSSRHSHRDDRSHPSSHSHARHPEQSSHRSDRRGDSRSRSRDRRHSHTHSRGSHPSRSHVEQSNRSTSPSQEHPGPDTSATVREASPEEGEITPPPVPTSKPKQSTSAVSDSYTEGSRNQPSSSSSRRPTDSRRNDTTSNSRRNDTTSKSRRNDTNSSAQAATSSSKTSASKRSREEDEVDYETLYTTTVVAPKKTAEQLLEEKRRARAAILAKYQQVKEGSASATPQPEDKSVPPAAIPTIPGTPVATDSGINSAVQKLKVEGTASPGGKRSLTGTPVTKNGEAAEVDTDDEDEGGHRAAAEQRRRDEEDLKNLEMQAKNGASGPPKESNKGKAEEDVSAADYDPENETMFDDRKERERLFMNQNEQNAKLAKYAVVPAPFEQAKHVHQKISTHSTMQAVQNDDGQNDADDDDDDDDDMFAVIKKAKKPRLNDTSEDTSKMAYVPVIHRASGTAGTAANAAGAPLIVDNFDDAEGYYRVILGEVLDGDRYHLTAHLGKGMFSNVVRARDRQSPLPKISEGEEVKYRDVAIKIMRSQESMYRAGQKEAVILRKLADADPNDKRHVIRLERTFEHRGHLCLVFESLSMNLRDVIKRFGKDVGINLKAVRAYAHQIFLALNLFSKLNIMHADIKPDNILVNESKSLLKVCDLGSAADTSEADITPYLVSRFYRAPEIILGLPYDCSLDMWSIGCTLYELYTGKILFPGRSNNHMLYLIQELKGRYPGRLVKKAKFGDIHFEDSNFVFVEKNKATGAESIKKMIIPPKPASDLKNRLMPLAIVKKLPEDEVKLLNNFVNLLDRALELDPSKRLTPKEALNHPFLR